MVASTQSPRRLPCSVPAREASLASVSLREGEPRYIHTITNNADGGLMK